MEIKILSFNHYTITVTDLKASLDFYVLGLGMTELPRPDFDFEGAWLDMGNNQQIHLILDKSKTVKINSSSRSLHFAFEVDHIYQAKEVLVDKGIEIVKDIKKRPDGILQFFIKDPDGYFLEFTQC